MKFDRFPSSYRSIRSSLAQQQQLPIRTSISRDTLKELHGRLIRAHNHTNPIAISPVLRSYSRSPSSLWKAQFVFDQIESPTLLIWNYMIRGFSQSDDPVGAIHLYDQLRTWGLSADNLTFIFVFKACGRVSDLMMGKRVHVHALKLGFQPYLYVSNALIHMYGSLGEFGCARNVFDDLPERDLVSWNSLICAYCRFSRFTEVVGLYNSMQASNVEADEVTLMKVLLACSHLCDWELAEYLVKHIEKSRIRVNVYLGNTLIDMYGKRGLLESAQSVFDQMCVRNSVSWNALIMGYAKLGDIVSARKLFNEMPDRDVISWTSLITGYCQVGQFKDAVKLFQKMMMEAKVEPDEITVTSVLSACSHLGMLNFGKEVHHLIRRHGIREDIQVGNALIDMYCKCGVADEALVVFQEMKDKDSVSWTSAVTGLAVNGFADHAIQLFDQMLKEKVKPTHGSFVGILLACAHAGLVDKGVEYFNSMEKVHSLVPQMKHYGCLVDLLSRSGCLERAYEFITSMPIQPDVVLWRILLSASIVHANVELAETVSRKLLQLDPRNSGNYVLLSQAYAGSHRWDAAKRLRDLMNEGYVHKSSGWSSIEAAGSQGYATQHYVPNHRQKQ